MSVHASDSELDLISGTPSDDELRVVHSLPTPQRRGILSILLFLPRRWKDDFIAISKGKAPSPFLLLLPIPFFVFVGLFVLLLVIIRTVINWDSLYSNYHTGFLVFGDYGRGGQHGQQMVADQMEVFCSKNKCDFVVTTGDNIYDYGVQSPDDPLFKTSFENVYLKGSLKNLKYYHVLGNHDWGGKPSAEIEYARRPDTAWVLPDYYYDETIGDIHFVFLDTTPLQSSVFPISNPEEIASRKSPEGVEKQLNFLKQSLAKSKAKWKFVVGHNPLYSSAEHGDNPEIIRVLDPIFKEEDITAYIAGHDHNQQHLVRSKIDYFISGAASALRGLLPGHWNLKFGDTRNGFMHVLVSDDHVLVRFYAAETLEVIHQTIISPSSKE